MKMILHFMRDYKKESILAPLFKMLEATLELLVPLVVASIIDEGHLSRQPPAYFFDVPGALWSGAHRPFILHHSPVLCRQVGGGRGDSHAPPAVSAHLSFGYTEL